MSLIKDCSEDLLRAFCEQQGKLPHEITDIEATAHNIQQAYPEDVGAAVLTIRRSDTRGSLKAILTFQTPKHVDDVMDALTDADVALFNKGWEDLTILNAPLKDTSSLTDFAAGVIADSTR